MRVHPLVLLTFALATPAGALPCSDPQDVQDALLLEHAFLSFPLLDRSQCERACTKHVAKACRSEMSAAKKCWTADDKALVAVWLESCTRLPRAEAKFCKQVFKELGQQFKAETRADFVRATERCRGSFVSDCRFVCGLTAD